MKHLYLLRHAKSSWDHPGLADDDRPLAPRGRQAAGLMAEHLRAEQIVPALVLCSPALRTRETLEALTAALGDDVPVRFEEDLYDASEDDLLERLRAVPDALESAMLIGHNPGIQYLAVNLAASGEALDRLRRKYPTGALATIAFTGRWSELEPGAAELTGFVRPKDL
jgi:phosphohistidine phosphatase